MGLSVKQRQLIELLADPTDTRNYEEKYAAVGVTRNGAWVWTKKKEYRDALRERTNELLTTARTAAIATLVREIKDGDTSAARIRASEVLLRVTDDIGAHVSVQTNVTVQNEIAEKSDKELDAMILEDREALLKLEDA
jgi:hypothetical protein